MRARDDMMPRTMGEMLRKTTLPSFSPPSPGTPSDTSVSGREVLSMSVDGCGEDVRSPVISLYSKEECEATPDSPVVKNESHECQSPAVIGRY